MGLDVYLYHYENRQNAKKVQKEYEKESEKLWTKFKKKFGDTAKWTDTQWDEHRREEKALYERLGYSFVKKGNENYSYEFKYAPGEMQIEENSKKHPDHMFKVGYFRSSYNAGGMEHVVGNIIGKDGCLYYIFKHGDEQYEFSPNWNEALKRVQRVMKTLNEKTEDGAFRVATAGFNIFRSPEDYAGINEKRAMEMFEAERKKNKERKPDPFFGGCYANDSGEFFFDEGGLKVRALIPGVDALGAPCVHAIYESSDLDWYKQALEVVEETIQFVLSKPDPQNYYLHWSS